MISETFKQKIFEQGFALGKPIASGWYLVFSRSNDKEEAYITDHVWFNGGIAGEFYMHCGCSNYSCQSTKYQYAHKIVAFKLLPKLQR